MKEKLCLEVLWLACYKVLLKVLIVEEFQTLKPLGIKLQRMKVYLPIIELYNVIIKFTHKNLLKMSQFSHSNFMKFFNI
jgi:hypothetical protein